MNTAMIPLSLYVHIPWCVKKCPYCDFNSHVSEKIPEDDYVKKLIEDMHEDKHYGNGRKLKSIFFGGGTPSLFSAHSIGKIIDLAQQLYGFADDIEITLETNPGTLEYKCLNDYKAAGVNRISFGVQSFNNNHLQILGRIHKRDEVFSAFDKARAAGFNNINIDLMHGLPSQNVTNASSDLQTAITLNPEHISWYQLTLEPNTVFYNRPPSLPDDDLLADIQDEGESLLNDSGYKHYEISAYSKPSMASKHNLNYWQFGDYIGIGAGAHGKISLSPSHILRYWKTRQPKDYLDANTSLLASNQRVLKNKLTLEFMMNSLRLIEGVPAALFEQRTGLNLAHIETQLTELKQKKLLRDTSSYIGTTQLGQRFLNEVLQAF